MWKPTKNQANKLFLGNKKILMFPGEALSLAPSPHSRSTNGSNMKIHPKLILLFVALVASVRIGFGLRARPQTQPDVIGMQLEGHVLVVSPQLICVTYSDNAPESPVAFLRGLGLPSLSGRATLLVLSNTIRTTG